jgi:hypothetical protein
MTPEHFAGREEGEKSRAGSHFRMLIFSPDPLRETGRFSEMVALVEATLRFSLVYCNML